MFYPYMNITIIIKEVISKQDLVRYFNDIYSIINIHSSNIWVLLNHLRV
jgi:hypothetical protein